MSPYAWTSSPVHADRMARFLRAGLYLVTSQELSAGRDTLTIVKAALRGGARLVQLREKGMCARELTSLAAELCRLIHDEDGVLIVNDRLDVAMAAGADGVHLGQDDLPIEEARRIAPDMILGASTHSAEEADSACRAGASYINIGPIFPTGTKSWDGAFLGLEGLRSIAPFARVPCTVMGGIKAAHIPDLLSAGARTIALVTAVTAAPDPESATRELLTAIRAPSVAG